MATTILEQIEENRRQGRRMPAPPRDAAGVCLVRAALEHRLAELEHRVLARLAALEGDAVPVDAPTERIDPLSAHLAAPVHESPELLAALEAELSFGAAPQDEEPGAGDRAGGGSRPCS
jgi:hypothetical protein